MEERQPMSEVIKETIDKVKSIADTKTVIGEPMTLIEGVTIIPVSRVSIAAALGGGEYGNKKDRKKADTEKIITDNFGGGGGTGITVTPVAFLVVAKGNVRLLPVAAPANTTVDRIVDMVPEVVEKISDMVGKNKDEEEC